MSELKHGVETITSPSIAIVNNVKTAVIGLIGTSGSGTANTLKLCTTETDDAYFGSTGSIPEALKAIRKQGPATVFVVSLGTGTPTAPTAPDFVGTYTNGVRTGLRLFETCAATYGFTPKIFIAPRFSSIAGVITALVDVATKYRGCAYLDAAAGTTPSAAIALRGVGALWAGTDRRSKLLFPMVKDSDTGTVTPLSAYAAGLRAAVDYSEGFWVSSSNHEIKGVSALETAISASINDFTMETNQLNAAGITTVFNAYGTGFREWGNRNASFPSATDAQTFESVQRTKDIIDESIEMAMLPYIDKPIKQAYIDMVRQTVNDYFNSLIARGALLEGSKCTYEPAKNSAAELAAGHVVFTTTYMSPTPAELITFDTSINTALLANLK